MGRKNSKAGQPNRGAQIQRHATRHYNNERFKYRRSDVNRTVLGPGSENLTLGPVPVVGIERRLYLVEAVA